MKEELYFAEKDGRVYIKPVGHITARLCPDLKKKVIIKLEEKCLSGILIDMSACDYMDSTFMGLLIGLNKRLLNASGNRVTIINPSKESRVLMKSLGMDKLLNFSDKPETLPLDMQLITGDTSVSSKILLKAHEDLMEISEQNRKKFALLHELLKSKIIQEEGDS